MCVSVCAHVHGVVLGWSPDFSKIGQECELCVFLLGALNTLMLYFYTAEVIVRTSLHVWLNSYQLSDHQFGLTKVHLWFCQNAAKSRNFTPVCHTFVVPSTLFIWFCDTVFAWAHVFDAQMVKHLLSRVCQLDCMRVISILMKTVQLRFGVVGMDSTGSHCQFQIFRLKSVSSAGVEWIRFGTLCLFTISTLHYCGSEPKSEVTMKVPVEPGSSAQIKHP